VKIELWNKLQDILIKLLESREVNGPESLILLINGGSLDFKFGSFEELPEATKEFTRMFLAYPAPSANDLFDSMLPMLKA